MVTYVDIIGLCLSVEILCEIYVMRQKCHVRRLCMLNFDKTINFHYSRIIVEMLSKSCGCKDMNMDI